ncbi:asparagine-linked glycosylation protein [Steccherinum ochraceum]|uniref:GDP-Man:Man(3)GlcNAc(2)-PP-Dol alpha-1,2-mannosyltransferase n=1 Tax=Steccherinum ochraceum TaxID=92696 RepID=A0A4R0RIV4_9APHY|nr:asparagine-linked glycosylation protein [Steccherinum ochraceum]
MGIYVLIAGTVVVLCTTAVVALASHLEAIRTRDKAHREALFHQLGLNDVTGKKIVGFFHPYCNAGGGGERVLWTAIAFLQRTEPNIISVIYSGDVDATKDEILAKVKARFDIALLPSSLHFVFLHKRNLIEDKSWPRFTMLGQSLGSMVLAWEAMNKLIPDLYIDTMGYAFTFHVVKLIARISVGSYTHYPTISRNMLERVSSRKQWHTNSDSVSSSSILSQGKLLYYRLFMYYYSYSLRQASFIMVNSSWTKGHIDYTLNYHDNLLDFAHLLLPIGILTLPFRNGKPVKTARIAYPPCDTRALTEFPLEQRERVILSLAQFRPEKDHQAQLRAFHSLLQAHPEYSSSSHRIQLVLIGGSRNADDANRVESLKALARTLNILDQVRFIVNASYPEMLQWLSKASIGLSTMVDEHFGINVVEFMAAGVIPVTHASGGPLKDIVVPFNGQPTGYHATSPETFAEALNAVLTLTPDEELAMRSRARTWAVQRFSEEEFEKEWDASGWKDWL